MGRNFQFDVVIESRCPLEDKQKKVTREPGDIVRLRQCMEVAELEGNLLLGVGEDPRTLGR